MCARYGAYMHAHDIYITDIHAHIMVWAIIINPRRAHALARVTVVGLSVCLSVCLSGLNLLLHASRATRYYTYVYFTMNARFNSGGSRILLRGDLV